MGLGACESVQFIGGEVSVSTLVWGSRGKHVLSKLDALAISTFVFQYLEHASVAIALVDHFVSSIIVCGHGWVHINGIAISGNFGGVDQ